MRRCSRTTKRYGTGGYQSSEGEKKLGITLGGYVSRARDLEKPITDDCDELQRAQIDLESFSAYAQMIGRRPTALAHSRQKS